MTRFAKTNRQGQSKSAPLADTATGYKTTPCPKRLIRTPAGLTQIGDVLAGVTGLPIRTAPYRMGGYRHATRPTAYLGGITDAGHAAPGKAGKTLAEKVRVN